jgi:release factor glutamine methyltransferase
VAPFRYLDLAVGPGVFVPRPETELLVTWVLDHGGLPDAPVVVDLCSGSGALALSFAHERPGARVYAVENDAAALEWLRRNVAARVAAGDPPVAVVAGDATHASTLRELDGTVDVLVCNPPYVPAGTPVPPEVAGHDPAVAVFADGDGLGVLAAVIERAALLLCHGGVIALEHDETQAEAVPGLLHAAGAFAEVKAHRDLAQRPRYATARRAGRLAYRDAL